MTKQKSKGDTLSSDSTNQLRKENLYSKGSISQGIKYSTLSSYSGRDESEKFLI